jgi:hypothetical protein
MSLFSVARAGQEAAVAKAGDMYVNEWLGKGSIQYRALLGDSRKTLATRLAMPPSGAVCFVAQSGSKALVDKSDGGSYFATPTLYSQPWDDLGTKKAPVGSVFWTGLQPLYVVVLCNCR